MWQTIRQWWQEERERWRYYWHMTRPAWYVELMTMLLIELSDHIAFLDFLDSAFYLSVVVIFLV